MKLDHISSRVGVISPAAFRRLCVETLNFKKRTKNEDPAAFRRLCVETQPPVQQWLICPPAAFRRLCVETKSCEAQAMYWGTSRLQAAVC